MDFRYLRQQSKGNDAVHKSIARIYKKFKNETSTAAQLGRFSSKTAQNRTPISKNREPNGFFGAGSTPNRDGITQGDVARIDQFIDSVAQLTKETEDRNSQESQRADLLKEKLAQLANAIENLKLDATNNRAAINDVYKEKCKVLLERQQKRDSCPVEEAIARFIEARQTQREGSREYHRRTMDYMLLDRPAVNLRYRRIILQRHVKQAQQDIERLNADINQLRVNNS